MIEKILKEAGAVAIGAAKCEAVDEHARNSFLAWLDSGNHADMGYMANHRELRFDPRLLLDDARTLISVAFPFAPSHYRNPEKGMIACYAYGEDYHEALRRRLRQAVEKIKSIYGGQYRICIDSAPVMERYWAVRTGIGTLGENGSVIVEGYGSMVFLAEIITTLPLSTMPLSTSITPQRLCTDCGRCVRGCPGGAIGEGGEVDSRRCISYLTIEHRGSWTDPEAIKVMNTPAGKSTIFGCDLCLRTCPLNRDLSPSPIPEFQPRPEIISLTREDVREMTQEEFSRYFKGSPIKRSKLSGLKRNCLE